MPNALSLPLRRRKNIKRIKSSVEQILLSVFSWRLVANSINMLPNACSSCRHLAETYLPARCVHMPPRLPTHVHSDLIILLVPGTGALLVPPAMFWLAKEVAIQWKFSSGIPIGKTWRHSLIFWKSLLNSDIGVRMTEVNISLISFQLFPDPTADDITQSLKFIKVFTPFKIIQSAKWTCSHWSFM